jgi:hypothetical protein
MKDPIFLVGPFLLKRSDLSLLIQRAACAFLLYLYHHRIMSSLPGIALKR